MDEFDEQNAEREPTEEEILAGAQARLLENRQRLAFTTETLTPLIAALPDRFLGATSSTACLFFCAGMCGAETARGAYCDKCAAAQRQQLRAMGLAAAYESLAPSGAMNWCRFGTEEYKARSAKAIVATKTLAPANKKRALELLTRGAWSRKVGNLLILGPKRIGKTIMVIAMGHKILDAALAGGLDAEAFGFAKWLRSMTGLDVGRARAETKLGDEPYLITSAKSASLLILDEIGFEDERQDPNAVRDIIYDRYRHGGKKPTIATSGCTKAELNKRYGSSMVERLTDMGECIDLHGEP